MNTMILSYTYWEAAEGGYIGFINQFPDYWTQGETREELEIMLKSLYQDIQTFDNFQSAATEKAVPRHREIKEQLLNACLKRGTQ